MLVQWLLFSFLTILLPLCLSHIFYAVLTQIGERCAMYNTRTCTVVKNSLPWKRGEKRGKKRGGKKQKMPDLTGGGDSNDISHCSLIQVNTAVGTWLYKYGSERLGLCFCHSLLVSRHSCTTCQGRCTWIRLIFKFALVAWCYRHYPLITPKSVATWCQKPLRGRV